MVDPTSMYEKNLGEKTLALKRAFVSKNQSRLEKAAFTFSRVILVAKMSSLCDIDKYKKEIEKAGIDLDYDSGKILNDFIGDSTRGREYE